MPDTNFPNSLDTFIDIKPTDREDLISHSLEHDKANDALTALETKVGVDNSAVTTTLDHLIKAGTDPGHTHSAMATEVARATAAEAAAIATAEAASDPVGSATTALATATNRAFAHALIFGS